MGNSRNIRILTVLGTRPEAIKLAPLALALNRDSRFHVTICTTGQHRELLRSALDSFSLTPDIDLDLMSKNQSLTRLFAHAAEGLERVITEGCYDAVVVQGDTTTCASAGLASFYLKVPIFHVEAGLRSSSLSSPFPEEFNRRLVSMSASGHFCPTKIAAENLFRENVDPRTVMITGNTGIDALFLTRDRIANNPEFKCTPDPELAGLKNGEYILATLHRRESFGPALKNIFSDLKRLAADQELPVILPLHPNPNVRAEAEAVFGRVNGWLAQPSGGNLYLCEPVEYVPFVKLMSGARLIVTDSGGIQEEGTALGKSMLICRDRTERPEALAQKNVRLIPPLEESLYEAARSLLNLNFSESPSTVFGDGHASDGICEGLFSHFENGFINPAKSSLLSRILPDSSKGEWLT